MAWNEPGSGKRDPWKNSGGNRQPPDMEELLRKLKEGMGRFFGGGGGSAGAGSFLTLLFALLMAWIALDSWTVIDARQVGVVLRFGEFSRLLNAGFNLKWPGPIEQVIKVEATQVRSVSDQVRMLTQDENIVQIDFNVQYQVIDARLYKFAIRDPEETLKQVGESAVRQVVGKNEMDTILSGQSAEMVVVTRKIMQDTLESYHSGLQVTEVNFQSIAPPAEVKDAFNDVNSAREDKQRIENEAQAYANNVVPVARGDASRIKAEATAYKAERIARAEGDAQRFVLLQSQYKAAPEATRKRLYLETMQQVLGGNLKVIDQANGRNLIYLPLDKLKYGSDVLNAGAGAELSTVDEHGDKARGGMQ